MPISKKLPREIRKAIEGFSQEPDLDTVSLGDIQSLAEQLGDWIEEQNTARDEKSDRWREGDDGEAHETFLGTVTELRDNVQAVLDAWEQIDWSEPEYGQ